MVQKSKDLIAHEKLCEERYKNIEEKLERLINDVSHLKKSANIGLGAWKAILGLGTILTIIWTVIKIGGK